MALLGAGCREQRRLQRECRSSLSTIASSTRHSRVVLGSTGRRRRNPYSAGNLVEPHPRARQTKHFAHLAHRCARGSGCQQRARRWISTCPSLRLRSTAKLRLLRLKAAKKPAANPPSQWVWVPLGAGSILTTPAPSSAKMSPLDGAFPVKQSFLVGRRFFVRSGKAVLRSLIAPQLRLRAVMLPRNGLQNGGQHVPAIFDRP